MPYIVTVALVLGAGFILLAIIGLLWGLMKGAPPLLLPGFGIVIATPLILLLLVITEAALLYLIFWPSRA